MARTDNTTRSEAEAAVWLARLHSDDAPAGQQKEFLAWCAADDANRAAFDRLTQAWDVAGGVERMEATPEVAPRRWARRSVLGAAMGGIAVAGGMGYYQAAIAGVYETRTGEQRRMRLREGSELLIDTDSRVQVHVTSAERRLSLVRGRCNLRVVGERHVPFVVTSDGIRLTITRGNVDIRRDDAVLDVMCLSGQVLCYRTPADASPVLIRPGDHFAIAEGGPARVDRPDPFAATAWQRGQLVFADRTLADAAAEMNRYSESKIVIGDPAVGRLRVSGVYRAGDCEGFARALGQLLGIQAEMSPSQIRLFSAA